MGVKILIADDESDIVSMLDSFFESKGFRVLTAFNGAETLKQVEKQPDIILLDINMPGTDGLEVCKRIRDHVSCPILFLTARIEDTDKVKGFAVGGDDYIVKPFSLVELEARVRAHLRREARHNFEAQIKFAGDLTIDYSERCLFFDGKRVGLAKKEFDIVELLSQNPGQVFDKERIYERIWGYDSEGDSSVVAEHIRRIRTKIAAYTDHIYVAALSMMIVMLPLFFLAMYEKDSQPLEVVVEHFIQTKFVRPKVRPYQTDNYYDALMRQYKLEKEVERIVFQKEATGKKHQNACKSESEAAARN